MNININLLHEYMKFNNKTESSYKEFYELLKKKKIIQIDDYYQIEDYIYNINPKEYYKRYKFAKISSDFVKEINKKFRKQYDSCFNNMFLKTERRVAIVKFLQNGGYSYNELADNFLCSKKTIQRDLNELKEGIKLNGIETKIKITHENRKIFLDMNESTIHFVNLNLNLTELYTLLIDAASKVSKSETTYDVYYSIMSRIYSQLTPYAKSIIDNHRDTISYTEVDNRYISEREMFNSDFRAIFKNAAKSCEFILASFKYKDKIIQKKVRVKENYDNGSTTYILKNEKGKTYECEENDLIDAKELE